MAAYVRRVKDKPTATATAGTATGGAITSTAARGEPFYQPTEAERVRVRTLAKAFPAHSEHLLARMMGFSRHVLRTYFKAELEMGRAELIVSCASQIIALAQDKERALKGIPAGPGQPEVKPVAKGDQRAMEFILMRMGGWGQPAPAAQQDDQGGGAEQLFDFDVSMIPVDMRPIILQQLNIVIDQRTSEAPDAGGSQQPKS